MPTYTTNYNIPKPLVNDPQDEDLWGDYLNDGMDIIDSTLASIAGGSGGSVPVGCGMDFWGTTAPSGWLFCYGQAVNRTTYAALFAAIGTVFGAGDGSTTFNLPDKRGRSSFGKDDMGGTSANRLTNQSGGLNGDVLGATGGAETHSLTAAQNGSHTHTFTTDSANTNATLYGIGSSGYGGSDPTRIKAGSGGTGQTMLNGIGGGGETITATYTATGAHTHTGTTATSGSGSAHNNVPPAIICNYIIKT